MAAGFELAIKWQKAFKFISIHFDYILLMSFLLQNTLTFFKNKIKLYLKKIVNLH